MRRATRCLAFRGRDVSVNTSPSPQRLAQAEACPEQGRRAEGRAGQCAAAQPVRREARIRPPLNEFAEESSGK
jgi:hypothetical protein